MKKLVIPIVVFLCTLFIVLCYNVGKEQNYSRCGCGGGRNA